MVTKRQFDKASKKMHEGLEALKELQDAEMEQYGFTHNYADLDWIIDAIDYGGGGCTFTEYKRLMQEAKRKGARED